MRLPRWWLRLCASTSEGPGLVPGQGTKRSCMLCGTTKKKKRKTLKKEKKNDEVNVNHLFFQLNMSKMLEFSHVAYKMWPDL